MLLDTHVVLWLVAAPNRLGDRCRQAVTDAGAVYVSAITHAELAMKAAIGKLEIPDGLPALLGEQGLQPLAFTDTHAEAMTRYETLARHDPFDRMLLAQADVERLTFATADRRLLGLGLSWVLDARA